jgi:phospholipase D1/2
VTDVHTSTIGGRRRVAAWLVIGVALVTAWILAPGRLDAEAFSDWVAPHRHAWYALPIVAASFVVLGLLLVPVVLLIAATGVAFGPWLGPLYAMAGSLASASVGFAIGRRLGMRRVEQLAGPRVARVAAILQRNGTLAVFLLRKIPLPFLLANMIAGAAPLRYRDFLIGTLLGMTAIVVALAGFGYHLTKVVDNPSPFTLLVAAIALAIPLTFAWLINRALRRARYAE